MGAYCGDMVERGAVANWWGNVRFEAVWSKDCTRVEH